MPARGWRVINGRLCSPEELVELERQGVDVRHCKQRKKKRSRSPGVRRRLHLEEDENPGENSPEDSQDAESPWSLADQEDEEAESPYLGQERDLGPPAPYLGERGAGGGSSPDQPPKLWPVAVGHVRHHGPALAQAKVKRSRTTGPVAKQELPRSRSGSPSHRASHVLQAARGPSSPPGSSSAGVVPA